MTAIPPLIPGSQSLSTLEVDKAKIQKLFGDSLSTMNTWKSSVKVATIVNITTLYGLMTIDGVSVVQGDYVLVKNQSNGINNGIYVVKQYANWQRRNDMILGTSVSGVGVYVNEGTVNGDAVFFCTNSPLTDVVGVDSLVFSGLITVASGLVATAGNLTINSTSGGLLLNTTKSTTTVADWSTNTSAFNVRQGIINVSDAELVADTPLSFTVSNNTVLANSLIFLNIVENTTGFPIYAEVSAVSTGVSFTVRVLCPVNTGSGAAKLAFAIM
jgi:hypothetical protein